MLQGKVSSWLALAGVGLLLALTGCGDAAQVAPASSPTAGAPGIIVATAQPQATPGSALPALPRPSTLLKPQPVAAGPAQSGKNVSYTLNDLGMDGSDFDQTLPRQNFSKSGKEATLMPSYTGHPADTSGLSFVTYHFHTPGYDRNPQVRLGWSMAPSDAHNVWLGLSRWDKDRWDWYQGSLSGIVNLPYIDKYFNFSGDLLLVVLRTGTDWSSHDSVSLGGPTPVAALSADTLQGNVPLSVHLDASASNPVEGAITKYEWDTDGDGTYDADTGTTPAYDVVYPSNGTFQATVRVTNTIHAQDEAQVTIVAVGAWQHTWGLKGHEIVYGVAPDADGNIYAAGEYEKTGGALNDDIFLAKYNGSGEIVWIKVYDSFEDEYCSDLGVDAAGNIILIGSQNLFNNHDALVQKWTPSGQLLWSRSYGSAGFERAQKVLVDGSDIYIAGDTDGIGATTDLTLSRCDGSGDLAWTATRDFGDFERVTDLSGSYDLAFNLNGLVLTADVDLGPNYNIVKLEYDTSGGYNGGAQLGNPAQFKYCGHILHVINFFTFENMYYVGGMIDLGSGTVPFLAKTDGTGAAVFGSAFDCPDSFISAMAFNNNGLNLCGYLTDGNNQDNPFVVGFNSGTGDVQGAETCVGNDGALIFSARSFSGGLLLAGRAADAAGTWSPVSAPQIPLTLSFSTFNGGGTQQNWSTSNAPGVVTDITGTGVIDTGGGGYDSLLQYRPAQ